MNTAAKDSNRRVLIVTAVLCVLCLLVAGCAGTTGTARPGASKTDLSQCQKRFSGKPGSGPLTTVIADRTASAGVQVLPGAIAKQLVDAARHNGAVTILGVDGGTPVSVVRDGSLMSNEVSNLDSARAGRIALQAPACVEALAATAKPTHGGSDVLQALQVGARGVPAEVRRSGQGTLVLLTDGLANVGALDLRTIPVAASDPAAVVRKLAEAGQVPQLDGLTVTIAGLGSLAAGPVNQVTAHWLVVLWTKICQAGGARSCTVADGLGSGEAKAGAVTLPKDPRVPLPEVRSVSISPTTCRLTLPAALSFGADSTKLLPGAGAALGPVVQLLRANPDATASLRGHMASVGNDIAFTVQRAQAVADAIGAAGIAPRRLTVSGAGSTEPAVNDRDAAGNLVESLAEQNRRVDVIVSGLSRGCAR